MPSKYSHNVVLAHYSSQGIISLPNDSQIGYLRTDPHSRAASAATSRQRAVSNATQSSDQHSLTARSITDSSRPRRYDLAGSTTGSKGRVLILDSDSDEEVTVSRQHSTPVPTRSLPAAASRSPEAVSKFVAQARRKRESQGSNGVARHPPSSSSQPPRNAHVRGNESIASSSTSQERHPGVHAFIHARHKKELADDEAIATTNSKAEDSSLSLKEFLKTATESKGQTQDRVDDLSLKDFLAAMPAPPRQDVTSTPEPAAQSSEVSDVKHTRTSSNRQFTPKRWANPPRETRMDEIANNITTTTSMRNTLPKHSGRGSFDLPDETRGPRFERPTMTSRELAEQIEREEALAQARDAKPEKLMPRSESLPPRLAKAALERLGALSSSQSQQNQGTSNTQELRPANVANTSRSATHSRLGHSQKQSIASSTSQESSTLGLSSTTQTTVVGSRDSPASNVRSKPTTPLSWGLPHPVQTEPIGHSFDHLFDDPNFLGIFDSDDEEDDEDHERVTSPHLQTVVEEEVFPQNKFGMISSGQDSAASNWDVGDDTSDISAVYPPDIGRYKYDGEAGGPLAMALAAGNPRGDVESNPVRRTQREKRRDKMSRGGIMGRLRIKASR